MAAAQVSMVMPGGGCSGAGMAQRARGPAPRATRHSVAPERDAVVLSVRALGEQGKKEGARHWTGDNPVMFVHTPRRKEREERG